MFIKRVNELLKKVDYRMLDYSCNEGDKSYAKDFLKKLHDAGYGDATQVDIDVINVLAYNEIDVEYCINAVRYYKDNTNALQFQDSGTKYRARSARFFFIFHFTNKTPPDIIYRL